MKLKDLRPNMVVQTAENRKYLLIEEDGVLCGIGLGGYLEITGYTEDLRCPECCCCDIDAVYRPGLGSYSNMLNDKDTLLWMRDEPRKEITMDEAIRALKQRFGEGVKIVD